MGQHKSTRHRCNTCKIRKVKCDEIKPACSQCRKQGHICTYNDAGLEYQSSVENLIEFNTVPEVITKSHRIHDDPPDMRFLRQPYSPLLRFALRTGPSLFTQAGGNMYPSTLLQLAHSRPYLKHAVLTVTITHDWIIHGMVCSRAATIQAHHMSACARSLHERLLQPADDTDRDALWASAALLMCASVAGTAQTQQSFDDLEWIRMCQRTANLALHWKGLSGGKLLMGWLKPQKCWPNVNLAGPAKIETQMLDAAIEAAVTDALMNEDDMTRDTLSTNLQGLMRIDCRTETIFNFLAWFGIWPDSLLQGIQNHDPNALLILAVWCAKTHNFRWWLSQRASVILQETCHHLERYDILTPHCEILLQYCKIAKQQNESIHRSASSL